MFLPLFFAGKGPTQKWRGGGAKMGWETKRSNNGQKRVSKELVDRNGRRSVAYGLSLVSLSVVKWPQKVL